VQPLLLFEAGAVLALPRARALLLALLPVSVLFAALGAYHPWPPGYEQASNAGAVAARVTNPIGGNAAALAAERAPGSTVARWLAARFVSEDPRRAREWLALFFASKGDLETMRGFTP
jgi:hypothetical protein